MIEELLKIIESIIRNIRGLFGKKLRKIYYQQRLGSCGKNLNIGIGVVIQYPRNVHIGDNVCLDDYCQLLAGVPKFGDNTTIFSNPNYSKESGEIHIGSHSHIGIQTIIQGVGGVETGNYFTTSPSCRIYSMSNDFKKCRKGTVGKDVFYRVSPLKIGHNVWMGINVVYTKGTLGDDIFVQPNAVITNDIKNNSIVGGQPAIVLKPRFTTS